MSLLSKAFIKKEAVKNNMVLQFLYVIATPLSRVFVKLNVSPNIITFISIFFAIAAFVSLVLKMEWYYYCLSWTLSLHLDFCDGTVARMTGKINKKAFRFDHMSDLFKISLIFLGAGLYYNTLVIWILSFTAVFLYLYATIMNHDLVAYNKLKTVTDNSDKTSIPEETILSPGGLIVRLKNSALILNTFSFFATINGHTLVFFLIIPFKALYTEVFLAHFILLSLYSNSKLIAILLKRPKIKIS